MYAQATHVASTAAWANLEKRYSCQHLEERRMPTPLFSYFKIVYKFRICVSLCICGAAS